MVLRVGEVPPGANHNVHEHKVNVIAHSVKIGRTFEADEHTHKHYEHARNTERSQELALAAARGAKEAMAKVAATDPGKQGDVMNKIKELKGGLAQKGDGFEIV